MNYKLSILVLLFTCFAFLPASRAGFWVKSHQSPAYVVHKATISPANSMELMKHPETVLAKFIPDHPKKWRSAGNEGQTALILGILGIPVFFIGPFAIVFGILGLRHDKKHRAMAITGLILGCITTFLYGLVFYAIIFG